MHFRGRVGALPGERETPQPLEVDLVVHADLTAAARDDDLSSTVDYATLFEVARRVTEEGSFALIEALAAAIASAALNATRPALVLELHRQSVDFLRRHDLVTIPPLAEEVWRMEMLSPEMQRIAPFFLGGEVVRVAFPTADMDHDLKLMSLRGNNEHFSRAVVHHELIPGHHLQGFMAARHNAHRRAFSTPFWHEGNALYWEMRLWDLDFPRGPEDRIGMLFWRNHRAARIIFSLGFHLGTMTPDEAIEFLVERVGHERANAEAEVRRSFGGRYSPLYQAAYLVGGLQFYALYDELVRSGRMSAPEFHDAILQGGRIPVEMVRALLTDVPLSADYTARWRFAGDPPLAGTE
jgi:dihydroneopterin aldolase